jgi:hypothetical protein
MSEGWCSTPQTGHGLALSSEITPDRLHPIEFSPD